VRGGERVKRVGQWHRHGPSRRHISSEKRIIGGDKVPGGVPQRGGNEGQWIDVRPRRRKVRRQDFQGQDRFQEEERLRDRDNYKLQQSMIRFASRDVHFYGDSDTVSVISDERTMLWGDYDSEEGIYDDIADQLGRQAENHHLPRRLEGQALRNNARVLAASKFSRDTDQ